MTKPTPVDGQKWNQFSRTGHPADYLAYIDAKNRRERPKQTGPNKPPL